MAVPEARSSTLTLAVSDLAGRRREAVSVWARALRPSWICFALCVLSRLFWVARCKSLATEHHKRGIGLTLSWPTGLSMISSMKGMSMRRLQIVFWTCGSRVSDLQWCRWWRSL